MGIGCKRGDRNSLIRLHVSDFAGLMHADDDPVIAFQHHDREGDRERAQPVGHPAFEDRTAEQQVADGFVGQGDRLITVTIHTLNHDPQRRAQIFQMIVFLSLTRTMRGDLDNAVADVGTPGNRGCIWIQLVAEGHRGNKRHGDAGHNRKERCRKYQIPPSMWMTLNQRRPFSELVRGMYRTVTIRQPMERLNGRRRCPLVLHHRVQMPVLLRQSVLVGIVMLCCLAQTDILLHRPPLPLIELHAVVRKIIVIPRRAKLPTELSLVLPLY